MEKVITKTSKTDANTDIRYWLSRTPEERIAAVEFLRGQTYDNTAARLQRVYTVVKKEHLS